MWLIVGVNEVRRESCWRKLRRRTLPSSDPTAFYTGQQTPVCATSSPLFDLGTKDRSYSSSCSRSRPPVDLSRPTRPRTYCGRVPFDFNNLIDGRDPVNRLGVFARQRYHHPLCQIHLQGLDAIWKKVKSVLPQASNLPAHIEQHEPLPCRLQLLLEFFAICTPRSPSRKVRNFGSTLFFN